MIPTHSRETEKFNEPGYLLSAALIGLLLLLFAAISIVGVEPGRLKPGWGTVLVGFYMLAWGCMFLASYYYGHKSFFLRGLCWFCEHLSWPRTRKMAFLYFALGAFMGLIGIFVGLPHS